MITKVLPPQKNREINYDNKGSAARLTNYFSHEAKELNEDLTLYFNQERDDVSQEEVLAMIDRNVKGLKKDDTKFVSLVIAPSEGELRHVNNDPEKLKEYTRAVMENYAKNFTLKDGRQLESKDLVWSAIVHKTRRFKHDDEEVKEGKNQRGDRKEGLQTHIHIIVSTRDQAQKITLNPTGKKERFNIVDWQKMNAEQFSKQFAYTRQTDFHQEKPHKERGYIDQVRYFEKRINWIANRYDMDERTVNEIRGKAAAAGYSKEFYQGFNAYTRRLDGIDKRYQENHSKADMKADVAAEFAAWKRGESTQAREPAHLSVVDQSMYKAQQMKYIASNVFKGAADNQDKDLSLNLTHKRSKRNFRDFNL